MKKVFIGCVVFMSIFALANSDFDVSFSTEEESLSPCEKEFYECQKKCDEVAKQEIKSCEEKCDEKFELCIQTTQQ